MSAHMFFGFVAVHMDYLTKERMIPMIERGDRTRAPPEDPHTAFAAKAIQRRHQERVDDLNMCPGVSPPADKDDSWGVNETARIDTPGILPAFMQAIYPSPPPSSTHTDRLQLYAARDAEATVKLMKVNADAEAAEYAVRLRAMPTEAVFHELVKSYGLRAVGIDSWAADNPRVGIALPEACFDIDDGDSRLLRVDEWDMSVNTSNPTLVAFDAQFPELVTNHLPAWHLVQVKEE